MKKLLFIALMAVTSFAWAAGNNGWPKDTAYTDVDNLPMVQRGARMFVNYCLGCHSAEYMRYNRLAEDLGIDPAVVERDLVFTDAKIGEPMTIAMTEDQATAYFGAPAPDLSVIARSRGVDWLYTYLRSFYVDSSRPLGWNNALFPNVSMPHVLWELQGTQTPVYETMVDEAGREHTKLVALELTTPGSLSEQEYDDTVRDLVAYLEYMGEPGILDRKKYGVWVLLYLALFTFLAWLLKREFWQDVH